MKNARTVAEERRLFMGARTQEGQMPVAGVGGVVSTHLVRRYRTASYILATTLRHSFSFPPALNFATSQTLPG